MTTVQLLPLIALENPDIEKFTFQYYPSTKLVQEQLPEFDINEKEMFYFAINMRDKYHFPFWDGIMLSAFDNPHASERLMKLALRHNHISQPFCVAVDNLSQMGSINHENLALCSTIINKNNLQCHIPMIDFHIPVSSSNIKVAEKVCKILALGKGWIVESGESYHFVGSQLYDWKELQEKLIEAIMFSPIIDKAWISHQLREKSCSLRVGPKNNIIPIVCESIK